MAIFLGTLLDGIPESLVLGLGLGLGGSVSVAFLAAVFVSNIPEGIAGTTSMLAEGHSRRRVYRMWIALVVASAGRRRLAIPSPFQCHPLTAASSRASRRAPC